MLFELLDLSPIIGIHAALFSALCWSSYIYKLCLFCEVSIESPVTVLGIQYLLLFR